MAFVAAAIALGVGTAAVGAYSANKAAKTQAGATEEAGRLTAAQYQQSRSDLSPYRSSGVMANNRLMELLGLRQDAASVIPPTTYQAGQSGDPLWERLLGEFQKRHTGQFGEAFNRPWDSDGGAQMEYNNLVKQYRALKGNEPQQAVGGDFGSLLDPFTGEDLENEPGYAFALAEGEKALSRAAARTGMRMSPATMKALIRFNSDFASTKFNDAFNRDAATKNSIYGMLSGTSNTGANSAGMTANLGANATGNIANMVQSRANANAAGTVGVGNAITGAATNVGNTMQNQYWLNQFLNQPKTTSSFGAGSSWGNDIGLG